MAAGLAAAGFGTAILPDHPFLHTMDLKLLPISGSDPKLVAYLSIPKYRWRPQAAQNFYQFCREKLGNR